ncbi:hypothetical protein AXW84_09515 [Hymenobacter sp. PAMC 26628]|nr:hypothetical protein AXW84_09515 [Hymenobacter sp. PAMC 26628]
MQQFATNVVAHSKRSLGKINCLITIKIPAILLTLMASVRYPAPRLLAKQVSIGNKTQQLTQLFTFAKQHK